jgi:ABC-type multidrug transport system fused ATPase/permease subunit
MNAPGILRKGWAMLGPHEKRATLVVFAISLVAAVAAAVMIGSIMPFLTVLSNPDAIRRYDYLGWTYERFGFTSDYDFLLFLAGLSLSVALVSGLVQLTKSYALSHYTSMRVHSIGSRLLRNYLTQEYEFFLSRHSGEMAKEIFSEAGMVVNNFYKPAMELVASAFTTLAIVAMLVTLNPLAALGVLSVLGTVFAVTYAISRPRVRYYGQLRAAYDGQRFRIANEALGGIKDIKIVGREDAYQNRFRAPSLAVAKVQVLASLFTMIPQFAITLTVQFGVILVCLFSVDRQSYLSGTGAQDVLPLVAVFGIAAQRLMPEMQPDTLATLCPGRRLRVSRHKPPKCAAPQPSGCRADPARSCPVL